MSGKQDVFLSVVIPFYNSEHTLKNCLDSLMKQTLSDDCYEVILINNNSNDQSVEIAKQYPFTLVNYSDKQSSYAARNIGLRKAKGHVIAFTDADCTLDRNWLKRAHEMFTKAWDKHDLLAGHIETLIENQDNPWEQYDKKLYLKQKDYVMKNKAATANLFVKSSVFNQIGIFKEVISSGDAEFTKRAVDNGYTLSFQKNIIAEHQSRKTFKEILKKSIRIEKGKVETDRNKLTTIVKRVFALIYISRYIYFSRHLWRSNVPVKGIILFNIGFFIIRLVNAYTYISFSFKHFLGYKQT